MKVTVVMEEESRDAAEAKPQAGQDAVAVPADGDHDHDDENDGDGDDDGDDGDGDGDDGGDDDGDDGATCSSGDATMEALSVPAGDHRWLQVHPEWHHCIVILKPSSNV